MKSQSELDEKVVVITGGAGLIGKSFVKAVIENGGTAILDANRYNEVESPTPRFTS